MAGETLLLREALMAGGGANAAGLACELLAGVGVGRRWRTVGLGLRVRGWTPTRTFTLYL